MSIENLLIDVARLAGSLVITVAFAYYLIKPDIQRYLKLKTHGLVLEDRPQLMALRLQAHERLILFIDRINPSNLFIRSHQQGISLRDLQSVLLNDIRSEYQHNVPQQLYLSPAVWRVITKLKDDTIAMINTAVEHLPEGAEGVDLSKKVLTHMADMKEDPYELTLDLIKKDIQQFF
jgi:hypothetical protein